MPIKDITPRDAEPPAPITPAIETPPPEPTAVETAATANIVQTPDELLKWIDSRLSDVNEAYDLGDVWEAECLPKLEDAFPPDREAADSIYRKHEARLEP